MQTFRGLVAASLAGILAGCSGGEDDGAPAVLAPAEIVSLAAGFEAEIVAGGLQMPVKLARAPDGRVFFTELETGQIRILDAGGNLLAAPFATVSIESGGECGLIGLALSPRFEESGHVYVMACIGDPDRQQVIRFTAAGDTGGERMILIDDLPRGPRHNAGDLQFLPDGTLLVSVGDTGDAALAQADGSRAGRILRFREDGSIPDDNPIPGSAEWARGLRNTFDMAVHPAAGIVLGSENGPSANDEINSIEAGKNYGWPALPPGTPDAESPIITWTPVIAPTGIVLHDGTGFGPEFANNLFVLTFIGAEIRRLRLSGPRLTSVDSEEVFAAFENATTRNRPLDAFQHPDGSLYVSTFTAIWRISRR